MIQLEKYDEIYLEKSWNWLNNPQIKSLTNTPDFTKEQQKKWFYNISNNQSYKIWGVSFDGIPIGVFGVKNIDNIKRDGEYWGYIGEKQYWGKGIGSIVLSKIIEISSNKLNLEFLYLKVLKDNNVAINFYKKFKFKEVKREDEQITMIKRL